MFLWFCMSLESQKHAKDWDIGGPNDVAFEMLQIWE